jgi:hypothetical protein
MKMERSPAGDANVFKWGRWEVYQYDFRPNGIDVIHNCPGLYSDGDEGYGCVTGWRRCEDADCTDCTIKRKDEEGFDRIWECDNCQARAPLKVRELIGFAKL